MTIFKSVCLLAILCLSTNIAIAEAQHCSLMDDHEKRLNCYGKNVKHKDWLVAKSNYFDSITVSGSAIHPVMCGDVVGSVSLGIVCAEEKTKLYFSASCVMGESNEKSSVLIQVDNEKPESVMFMIPNNKYALNIDGSDSAIQLAQSFLGRERLHIKISPSSRQSFTATFDVSDLERKIAPLSASCNW